MEILISTKSLWYNFHISKIIQAMNSAWNEWIYSTGTFSPNYKLTIGVDFALKVIYWDEATKVNLQLW